MHQTKIGQQWYFGRKAHIGADSKTKLIHAAGGDGGERPRHGVLEVRIARRSDTGLGRSDVSGENGCHPPVRVARGTSPTECAAGEARSTRLRRRATGRSRSTSESGALLRRDETRVRFHQGPLQGTGTSLTSGCGRRDHSVPERRTWNGARTATGTMPFAVHDTASARDPDLTETSINGRVISPQRRCAAILVTGRQVSAPPTAPGSDTVMRASLHQRARGPAATEPKVRSRLGSRTACPEAPIAIQRRPVMTRRPSAAGDASTGRYARPDRRTAAARRRRPRLTNRIAAASLVNSWRVVRPAAPIRPKLTYAVQRPNRSAPATTRQGRCRFGPGSLACNSMRISVMESGPGFLSRGRVNNAEVVRQAVEISLGRRTSRHEDRHRRRSVRGLMPAAGQGMWLFLAHL